MEEPARRRHCEQIVHFHRAAGLAKDRDIPGISPEGGYVVPDPFEGEHEVLYSY